jgi:SAM-dependent methyltransferase
MADSRLRQLMIEAMAKHLPPSASRLRLLDVNGETEELLCALRRDLDVIALSGSVDSWADAGIAPGGIDAVVAYGYVLNDRFLQAALDAMRPGGRLILVDPRGEVEQAAGERLEAAGYTRILVEVAIECPLPAGVLIRGEKPHTTPNTLERIQQTAVRDADRLDLETYRGRYVHLLVSQSPDKPAWRLEDDEVITWLAVAVQRERQPALLAFSSLPKAVGFMQPAVLAGRITGVNKVGKFRRETASAWSLPVLLNPAVEVLGENPIVLVAVDHTTAEAPDE